MVNFIFYLNNVEYWYRNNVFTKDSFLFVGMILFSVVVVQLHHVPVKNRSLFTLVKKKIVIIARGLILRMIKWFDRQLVHVCQYHCLNSIVNRMIQMVSSSVTNLLNLFKFIENAMLFSFTAMNQRILTACSWFKVMLR